MSRRPDLRCSTLTAGLGESPAGTAGSWHRVVLVELPLPWPPSIALTPSGFEATLQLGDGRTAHIREDGLAWLTD